MQKIVVESRDYRYVYYLLITAVILIGLSLFTQIRMAEITAKYLPKHESVRNLPSQYQNSIHSEENSEKDSVRYFFLASITMISIFLSIFSFMRIGKQSLIESNKFEQIIIIFWFLINSYIVFDLLWNYWSNDLLENKFLFSLYIFFLTIPMLIAVYFGTIQGKLINESDLIIKQKSIKNNSKLRDLKSLLENDLISEEQYHLKRKEILYEIIKDRVENDQDFISLKVKLKNAVDSNLMNKVDAENKIKEYREEMLKRFYSDQNRSE